LLLHNWKRINGFWQKYVPKKYIFDGFLPGTLQAIMDDQAKIIEEWHATKHNTDFNPYILLIMDDVISDDLHHAPELKTLFYNGRHLKMQLFISLQYAKGLPPGFRENLDQAYIFQLHSINQVEATVDNWLGKWDKKTAINLLETVVWRNEDDQRQALVVDVSGSFQPTEILFAAQATDPGDFVIGCRQWWKDDHPSVEPVAQLYEHPDWEPRE
jgi:hypothetical protein